VLQDGKLAEGSLCKTVVNPRFSQLWVPTVFVLGPVLSLDTDILEVDASVLEEVASEFGGASAVEVN
jgi:hypothetical protein